MSHLSQVSLSQIQRAKKILEPLIPETPLIYNPWLSEELGCKIYLKLENMQPIGSFKIRGATYRISQLSTEEKKRGVIAASAGNHAQGVAWGAKKLGVNALIVMPKTAPLIKINNTESFGAQVVLEGNSYEESFQYALKLARKTKRVFVHAFDDPGVIAGQGTVGLELFEQLPDLDYVVCSIGGGGLMSGIATVMRELRPQVKLVGAQASGCAAMLESFKQGKPITLRSAETFADGIAVSATKKLPFSILKKSIHKILKADDEAIAAAILELLEKARVVSEGAAAVSLAVLKQMKKEVRGKKVVILVCGGNIDVNVLNRVIDRGLIQLGRRIRVNVKISDQPGSLAQITSVIAKSGANVIQAIHDREEPAVTIGQTEVRFTLETRGVSHSREVIRAIQGMVLAMEVVG